MSDYNYLTNFCIITTKINNMFKTLNTQDPKIINLLDIFIMLNRAYYLMYSFLIIKKIKEKETFNILKEAYNMFNFLYTNIKENKSIEEYITIDFLLSQIHECINIDIENLNDICIFIINCFTYIFNSLKEKTIIKPNLIILLREWEKIILFYEKTECKTCKKSIEESKTCSIIETIECNKKQFFCRSCSRIFFPEKINKMPKHPLFFQNAFFYDIIPLQPSSEKLIPLVRNTEKRKMIELIDKEINKFIEKNEKVKKIIEEYEEQQELAIILISLSK